MTRSGIKISRSSTIASSAYHGTISMVSSSILKPVSLERMNKTVPTGGNGPDRHDDCNQNAKVDRIDTEQFHDGEHDGLVRSDSGDCCGDGLWNLANVLGTSYAFGG